MRYLDENITDWNFIDKCTYNSISDKSCISGIIILVISFLPLFFNIYAFSKMTAFYKKLNFENGIILISAIEIFILEFALTTSFDFFLQSFFFLQIITISLLIKKFSILIKDIKSIFKKNIFFILLNIINLIIFILYIIFIAKSNENTFIINLVYKIFYLFSVCILSYIGIFLNRLISQHKREYIENYNSMFDPGQLSIDSKEISGLGSIISDGSQPNNNIVSSSNSKNKDINNLNYDTEKKKKGERFYHIKRKQNKCLYIINLICSIIEFIFTIIRFFILDKDFLKHKTKIVPITFTSEIIYYIYIFICLVNVSVIFFCFYFYIRRQYSRDTKVFKKRPSKKILDEAFIEEQIKQDEGSDMNGGIITDRKKMRKKSSMDQFNDIVITKKFDNN